MGSAKKNNGKKRKRGSSRDNLPQGNARSTASAGAGASSEASSSLTSSISSSSSALPSSASSPLFLTSRDPGFERHVSEHYKGFAHRSVDQLEPGDFHRKAREALERLRDANYYQYDIVMAGGKHSSRTFVKRTLVGNPGITYKYLGLRLFAHAWSGPGVSPLMRSIGEMNRDMIRMTQRFFRDDDDDEQQQRQRQRQLCEYNLTLINYMEPTIHTRVGFKDEANYGMGKVSVSWHADSSLESGSSIGVYHCLPTQRSSKWDWRIALRRSPEASASSSSTASTSSSSALSDPAPKPIVVDTKDGDAYFLLGNFNETHQHCVLAGSQTNRISSTHRVAVTAEDTYDYILRRVKIARKRFRLQLQALEGDSNASASANGAANAVDAKVIRYCQRVLTEVETEWIAQYWLQGAQHDVLHTWWQRPMKTLEAYWRALEVATAKLVFHASNGNNNNDDKDKDNNGNDNDSTKTRSRKHRLAPDVIRVLIQEFKNRQSLREQWDERRADKIYQRRIAEEYRPVERPLFDNNNNNHNNNNNINININNNDGGNDNDNDNDNEPRLPKDLAPTIRDLKQLLVANTNANSNANAKAGSGGKGASKTAPAAGSAGRNDTKSSAGDTPASTNHPGREGESSSLSLSNPKKKKRRKKNHNSNNNNNNNKTKKKKNKRGASPVQS